MKLQLWPFMSFSLGINGIIRSINGVRSIVITGKAP